MPRTFTGERIGTFSQLFLQELTSDGSSRLRDALELFLQRDEVKQIFDETSDLPPSCQAVAAFVLGEMSSFLPDQDIPLGNLVTLMQWITGNFRTITNQSFTNLTFQDTDLTMVLVKDKFQSISQGVGRRPHFQFFNDYPSVYSPQVSKTVIRRQTNVPIIVEQSHNFHLTRQGGGSVPEYTLQLESAYKNGRLLLMKDGVEASRVELFPDSSGSQNQVLHTDGDPTGNTFWSQDQVSSGSGGSGADGTLASMDFLSDTGKIRSIDSSGGIVTTPQSVDDRYYTRDEVNALLAPIQALTAVLSFQLSNVQASLPKVRLNPGEIPVPFKIISFDSGSMAEVYDSTLQHVHVWTSATSPPIDSSA